MLAVEAGPARMTQAMRSLEAVFLTSVVLMTQNYMTRLAERRAQGADTESRTQEIAAQLERLVAIEANLAQLRDRLWASSTDSTGSPTNSAT